MSVENIEIVRLGMSFSSICQYFKLVKIVWLDMPFSFIRQGFKLVILFSVYKYLGKKKNDVGPFELMLIPTTNRTWNRMIRILDDGTSNRPPFVHLTKIDNKVVAKTRKPLGAVEIVLLKILTLLDG